MIKMLMSASAAMYFIYLNDKSAFGQKTRVFVLS